jgi:TetR/AcrR family transcriptional regulator, transcriptional repressor for nem operon
MILWIMARFKEFDTDVVLDKAIDVFRSKGFKATSVQDLVSAMGINRGSIYDTFGNKIRLFNLALSRYQIDAPSQKLLNNADTGNPRKEIEDFFNGLLNRYSCSEEKRGCLITNSIVELANQDKTLTVHFKKHIKNLEDALYTLIRRGQETGDITPWRDPRSLARTILASAQGMTIISKVNPSQEVLSDIAKTVLSSLD